MILILLTFYIYGNYSINNNQKNLRSIEDKFSIKVISPNFELKYGLSNDDIKKRLKNLIKYSEPNLHSRTIFIWPEGVFLSLIHI